MILAPKDTPLQQYEIDGVSVWVKREDLCWPFPALSKARGVYEAMIRRPGMNMAVVDTARSLNGQLVATIGLTLGRKVICAYPVYKASPLAIPGSILAIKSLEGSGDVELVPLQANRQFVMRFELIKRLEETGHPSCFIFPTGLRLPETVTETYKQMVKVQAEGILSGKVGTVIVPTGTGTHLAGILRAFSGDVVAVQGYARPEARFRADVQKLAGADINQARLRVITSLCDYFEVLADRLPPFPANMHYEVRAWKWLSSGNIGALKKPIVFWNIGA